MDQGRGTWVASAQVEALWGGAGATPAPVKLEARGPGGPGPGQVCAPTSSAGCAGQDGCVVPSQGGTGVPAAPSWLPQAWKVGAGRDRVRSSVAQGPGRGPAPTGTGYLGPQTRPSSPGGQQDHSGAGLNPRA